ncbi:MAG: FG-GAP-like repeat-containing protein, partial [archaeon]
DPKSNNWPRHTVASNYGTLNSMDVGDFNSDGNPEVVVGEHRAQERVVIFENVAGGSSWTPHTVSTGKESHLGTRPVDLDGDGDLDIVSIACDADEYLHLWRNDNDAVISGGNPCRPIS